MNDTQPIIEGPLTTRQAGEYLGVTEGRIRQYILEGRLPSVKFGRDHQLSPADLDALARTLAEEAPRKPGPKPKAARHLA